MNNKYQHPTMTQAQKRVFAIVWTYLNKTATGQLTAFESMQVASCIAMMNRYNETPEYEFKAHIAKIQSWAIEHKAEFNHA